MAARALLAFFALLACAEGRPLPEGRPLHAAAAPKPALGSCWPHLVESLQANEAPVIGVVSQSLEKEMLDDERFAGFGSYIMKSYVTWLQAAGARVVPLVRDEPQQETLRKLAGVNGVLFPGGDGDYLDYGRFVYQAVRQANDEGAFLPLWGTCLGYENLVSYVATEGWGVLDVYDIDSASLALELTVPAESSQLYRWLGADAHLFETHAVAYNSHHWSMDPAKFASDPGLAAMFNLTAIARMPAPDGRPIVQSIESSKYPFYGTQFHPEKSASIFNPTQAVNHSWIGLNLNQHMAEMFVFEARASTQSLGSYAAVQREIIENYKLIVSDQWFDAVYVFP